MTDDQQLRDLFDRMCQAWTAGDAEEYGRCFTADCDYVSFDGYHERGRDAMVASHDKLFLGVLFGSALVGQVESVRHLGDGVAVMHATGSVLTAWRKRLPKRRLTATPSWPSAAPKAGAAPPSTTAASARWASPPRTRSPPEWPAAWSGPPGRCTSATPRRPRPPAIRRRTCPTAR